MEVEVGLETRTISLAAGLVRGARGGSGFGSFGLGPQRVMGVGGRSRWKIHSSVRL